MKKLLFAVLLVCSSCGTRYNLLLKPDAQLQRLGICFKKGVNGNELVARSLNRALEDFITSYNASPRRKFELYSAQSESSATLTIELFETQRGYVLFFLDKKKYQKKSRQKYAVHRLMPSAPPHFCPGQRP